MYQVVDKSTKKAVETGFASRQDAKPARDKLNGSKAEGNYIVSRGEKHPRGPSFGPVHQDKRWIK